MRIIAGELKGRRIELPRGSRSRPLTGFLLEKAVNLFGEDRISSGAFLDLCSGSGIMGLEALSRGAQHCIFVESNARMARHIKDTAESFDVASRASVLRTDARRCFNKVSEIAAETTSISCIFMDPPFIEGFAGDLLSSFAKHAGLFDAGTMLILRSVDEVETEHEGLRLIEQRKAGNGTFWIFECQAAE